VFPSLGRRKSMPRFLQLQVLTDAHAIRYDWVAYPGSIYSSVIISEAIPEGTMSEVLGWDVL
jgi:hypothetical protein